MSALRLASARHAWRHPWQLLLALAGVALGVAVVSAVDLSIASSRLAFERSHAAVAGRTTHVLRAEPGGVSERLYAELRRKGLPVRLAPVVEGYVSIPGEAPRTARILGIDLFAEAPFRPDIATVAGRAWLGDFLSRPDGVVMSTGYAASLGLEAGDRFRVRAGGRAHVLVVLGLMETPDKLEAAALSDLLVMNIAGAQQLFERAGVLSRVDVMLEGEAEREARKQAELAPWIEAAMARKPRLEPLAEERIPTIAPLGRNIVQTSVPDDAVVTQHIHADITVPLQDPLARRESAD